MSICIENRVLPRANEVHVFAIELDDSANELVVCEKLLNAEELARANRFLHHDVRRRFVICRGRLRQILASYAIGAACEIEFRYDKWGKPHLRRSPIGDVHFNVSHSGEWALIAVARSPVGIDLEVPNERISYRAIAPQILSTSEKRAWDAMPASERGAATMQLWVCKEALLKALGLGIADGLLKVCFALPIPRHTSFSPASIAADLQMHLEDEGSCRSVHWIDASTWRMQMLDIIPDCYAVLCTMPNVSSIKIFQ